jgi:uncharacterized protein (TIGR02001 family)
VNSSVITEIQKGLSMKKLIFATLAALSLVSPLQSQAQGAGLLGIKGLSANVGAVSDYRFRGITQTYGGAALQVGVDYSHSSGLYVGNWNSNINEGAGYPSSHIESDIYGGFKKSFNDLTIDVGVITYLYSNSNSSNAVTANRMLTNARTGNSARGDVDNTEVYGALSWKWLTVKYSHALSNYFSMPDTSGTNYLDFSGGWDLGNGWGVNAHVGLLRYKGLNSATVNGDYNDYKIGVTKEAMGLVFGASLITTDASAGTCTVANFGTTNAGFYCYTNNLGNPKSVKNAGADTLVLSVVKNF